MIYHIVLPYLMLIPAIVLIWRGHSKAVLAGLIPLAGLALGGMGVAIAFGNAWNGDSQTVPMMMFGGGWVIGLGGWLVVRRRVDLDSYWLGFAADVLLLLGILQLIDLD